MRQLSYYLITLFVVITASARFATAEDFIPVSACGIKTGSRILEVTNLNASGIGSLLEATKATGPKVIVFNVGGVIALTSDIEIKDSFVTLAGETAPEPGITLVGGTLRIRGHDICVRHISVRPGPASSTKIADTRDGIAVGGNPAKYGGPTERILLENVSVSWAVDENLSIWHIGTRNVQIRNVIVSEALRSAGHPKGNHSMGMLIASDVFDVEISGTLFAHNNDRNPRISPRTSVSVKNSVVYNPGRMSTEIFLDCRSGANTIRLENNIFIPGPDTYRGLIQYQFIDSATRRPVQPEHCDADFAKTISVGPEVDGTLEHVLLSSGSRPAFRNGVDSRLINEVRITGGGIIDLPPSMDLQPEAPKRPYKPPQFPFSKDSDGHFIIEMALCHAHLALGGEPYLGCRL